MQVLPMSLQPKRPLRLRASVRSRKPLTICVPVRRSTCYDVSNTFASAPDTCSVAFTMGILVRRT